MDMHYGSFSGLRSACGGHGARQARLAQDRSGDVRPLPGRIACLWHRPTDSPPRGEGKSYSAAMEVRTAHPSDRDAIEDLLARRRLADGHPPVSEHKAIRLLSPEQIGRVVVDGGNGDARHTSSAMPSPLVTPGGRAPRRALDDGDRSEPGHPPRRPSCASWWRPHPTSSPTTPRSRSGCGDPPRRRRRRRWGCVGCGLLAEMGRLLPTDLPWQLPDRRRAPTVLVRVTVRPGSRPTTPPSPVTPRTVHSTPTTSPSVWRSPGSIPMGFLLAWDGERLAGFCWTKVHDDGRGEIYILAVVPGSQGRGLGRALLLAGLDDLQPAPTASPRRSCTPTPRTSGRWACTGRSGSAPSACSRS